MLTIIWTLALANVVGATLCLSLSGLVSRISLIPGKVLVPFLFVVMIVASYQSTRHWGDIITFVAIGLLGWIMKQVDWPRAPLIIGFVLSTPAERYLHLSMSRYGFEWLTSPIVIGIAVAIVAILFYGTLRGDKQPDIPDSVRGPAADASSGRPAGDDQPTADRDRGKQEEENRDA